MRPPARFKFQVYAHPGYWVVHLLERTHSGCRPLYFLVRVQAFPPDVTFNEAWRASECMVELLEWRDG